MLFAIMWQLVATHSDGASRVPRLGSVKPLSNCLLVQLSPIYYNPLIEYTYCHQTCSEVPASAAGQACKAEPQAGEQSLALNPLLPSPSQAPLKAILQRSNRGGTEGQQRWQLAQGVRGQL